MLLFAVLFTISFTAWYWTTQRNIILVSSLSKKDDTQTEEPKIPRTAAFSILLDRLNWALPFLWDVFRLFVVPYVAEKIIERVSSFVF